MSGAFERRNVKYIQATFNDKDNIVKVLNEAVKAKSKMVVGLTNEAIGEFSLTADVVGSSKAVNKFAAACEIPIK